MKELVFLKDQQNRETATHIKKEEREESNQYNKKR